MRKLSVIGTCEVEFTEFMGVLTDFLLVLFWFTWAGCPYTGLPRTSLALNVATLHRDLLQLATMDSQVIKTIQKDIQELKDSLNYAHENNSQTQTQVSDFKSDIDLMQTRLGKLEAELTSLRKYAIELENYCISLDNIVRKHHLLLAGVCETKGESVSLAAYRVLQVCFPEIHISDIDYCYRIGTQGKQTGKDKSPVRPIIVKLVREEHRRLIYKNRQILRQSDTYSKVFINEDLPQVVSQRRANVRSVYLNAINKGHTAKMMGTNVVVDNVSYSFRDLEILPPGLRLSDAKMVRVKGGIAFASEYAFLSNFYSCSFTYDGVEYDSAERAYQCTRARRLQAPDLAQQIYGCRDAKECKKLSHHVFSNPDWDHEKQFVMKAIVTDKFSQNPHLQEKLLLTGTKTLIEATTDPYWGAGVIIGSK